MVYLPLTMTDGTGYQWDIQTNGSIDNGSNDAFDGGMVLSGFWAYGEAATEDADRELVIGPYVSGNFSIFRKVYIPDTGQGFARYLEIITNNSGSVATFNLQVYTNLGSDSLTQIVGTSSGDTTFDTSDNYLVTDDQDNIGDPSMAFLFYGNGSLAPSTASLSTDTLSFTYNLTLAPGETQIVMHFASQNPNQATALSTARWLSTQPVEAFSGLSTEEIGQIVNFKFGVFSSVSTVLPPGEIYLTLTGTANINGAGNELNNFIIGNSGNNALRGLAGNDGLYGNEGHDTLIGADGNDRSEEHT